MHPAYCSSPKDLTTIGLSSVPAIPHQQLTFQDLPSPLSNCGLISSVPRREASNGFMSKISMPCTFPKISNRSKPVACSRSVGMVPGAAPGPMRSASLLISVYAHQQPFFSIRSLGTAESYRTLELLDLALVGSAGGSRCCFSCNSRLELTARLGTEGESYCAQ